MGEPLNRLTHFDDEGQPRMVEVSGKPVSRREARAEAWLTMDPTTLEKLAAGELPKGEVATVARLAGIAAAKKTWDLIPLCHPLPLTGVEVELELHPPDRARLQSTVRCEGKTGVEMEALTAVSVAALTVYDMVKAVDKGVVIGPTQLLAKSGGRSGDWQRGRSH